MLPSGLSVQSGSYWTWVPAKNRDRKWVSPNRGQVITQKSIKHPKMEILSYLLFLLHFPSLPLMFLGSQWEVTPISNFPTFGCFPSLGFRQRCVNASANMTLAQDLSGSYCVDLVADRLKGLWRGPTVCPLVLEKCSFSGTFFLFNLFWKHG